jgi:hypothetical protein
LCPAAQEKQRYVKQKRYKYQNHAERYPQRKIPFACFKRYRGGYGPGMPFDIAAQHHR